MKASLQISIIFACSWSSGMERMHDTSSRRRQKCKPTRSVGRVEHAVGFLAWPKRGSTYLADRCGLRSGTRFRSPCLWRAREVAPQPSRRSFFKPLLGLFVGLGMARTHGEPAVAELCQYLANPAFMQHDIEASFQLVAQIHAPPAHHPMTNRIGSGVNQPGQFGLLLRCEFWLWTWRL